MEAIFDKIKNYVQNSKNQGISLDFFFIESEKFDP